LGNLSRAVVTHGLAIAGIVIAALNIVVGVAVTILVMNLPQMCSSMGPETYWFGPFSFGCS